VGEVGQSVQKRSVAIWCSKSSYIHRPQKCLVHAVSLPVTVNVTVLLLNIIRS